MSDKPDQQDSFEREYAALKLHGQPLSYTGETLAQKDRVITQFLSNNFNGNSAIQTDHLGRKSAFGALTPLDIETLKIEANLEDLDDFNTDEVLAHKTDRLYVINKLIAASPSLNGLTVEVAAEIENHTLNDTKLRAQFPNADLNIVKATAYTLLNAHNAAQPNGKPDQNLQDMALTHLHYVQDSNKAYSTWSAGKQAEIAKEMAGSHSLMADLKQLRCPQNVVTTEELAEQFELRQRIARTMTDIYAKAYNVQDTLKGEDDTHIVYKSRDKILKEPAMAYASANLPGVVNDETVILRYNPAASLTLQNTSMFAATNQEEASLFLTSMTEELQHTVDNITADKAILGQTAQNPALEQHTIAYSLNKLYYVSPEMAFPSDPRDSHLYQKESEKYANQYVESTAKISAEAVTSAVMKSYDAPLPPQPATTAAENSTLDTILTSIKNLNPFK